MHYHQTIFAKPVIPTLPTTMANVWHKLDVWMFTNQIQETRHVLHAEIIFIMFTNIIHHICDCMSGYVETIDPVSSRKCVSLCGDGILILPD